MDAILWEWVNFALRWLHVIVAIGWIGASFYFVHLDLSLRKQPDLPAGVSGEAWQVHGGGFYQMRKYMVAPAGMPDELTWFKWDAYATWLSGFALMVALYYVNPSLYLIDKSVLDLSPWAAIAISVAGLVLGWVVYDLLCKSPLGRNDAALAVAGLVLIAVTAYAATHIFAPRGAFLQVGAMIATIMAANVGHIIMPNQRKIVADLIAGRTPDPALGKAGKQRSMHNNYVTLPVVFLMLSNHYPASYAIDHSWLVIVLVTLLGAAVRHALNTHHREHRQPAWAWGAAALALAGIIALSWYGRAGQVPPSAAAPNAAQVADIVASRCAMCHAREPVWEGIAHAPKGVALETADDLARWRRDVVLQAGYARAMPPGNITEITEAERAALVAWYEGRT